MDPSFTGTSRDFFQGAMSAISATFATNPLLHWQYCRVENMPFRLQDIWRGASANFFSYFGFMCVAHLSKGALRNGFERWKWKQSDGTEVAIGLISGGASVVAVCPGERVAALDNKTGKGNLSLFREIIRHDGFRGLYRGFLPTLGRDCIAVGGVLTWGAVLQRKISNKGVDSSLAMLFSSLATGFGTCIATQPLQVLRINLQVDRSCTIRGIWRRLKQEPFKQKTRTLYAGLLPRTTVNVVLVACGIFIDDNLERLLN